MESSTPPVDIVAEVKKGNVDAWEEYFQNNEYQKLAGLTQDNAIRQQVAAILGKQSPAYRGPVQRAFERYARQNLADLTDDNPARQNTASILEEGSEQYLYTIRCVWLAYARENLASLTKDNQARINVESILGNTPYWYHEGVGDAWGKYVDENLTDLNAEKHHQAHQNANDILGEERVLRIVGYSWRQYVDRNLDNFSQVQYNQARHNAVALLGEQMVHKIVVRVWHDYAEWKLAELKSTNTRRKNAAAILGEESDDYRNGILKAIVPYVKNRNVVDLIPEDEALRNAEPLSAQKLRELEINGKSLMQLCGHLFKSEYFKKKVAAEGALIMKLLKEAKYARIAAAAVPRRRSSPSQPSLAAVQVPLAAVQVPRSRSSPSETKSRNGLTQLSYYSKSVGREMTKY